jgi:hypothetical protein
MATPCSVKTRGKAEECFNLSNRSQFVTSSCFSALVSLNMKSGTGEKHTGENVFRKTELLFFENINKLKFFTIK